MSLILERYVQAIWYDVALRPNHLQTQLGQDIKVISPGEWNLGSGPDFLNAVLEISETRRRIVGDVEVHVCPSDWDFHRHGSDPNYRNVIAHITWRNGQPPASLPRGAVSIWLGHFVEENTKFSPQQIDISAYPYARLPIKERPCLKRLHDNPDLTYAILEEAGRRRLRLKARRIEGRLCEKPLRRQVFYEEVMTALGYVNNAKSFRRIAERVLLDELPHELVAAQKALLVASSFETLDRHCGRPYNMPEIRLRQAAELFSTVQVCNLVDCTRFCHEDCREMIRVLRGGSSSVGAGRAAAIIANVIVPFALAEGRIDDVPDWLPAEDISAPVRLTAFRLLGRDHNPKAIYAGNGLLIQGLLQIHREYCLRRFPNCARCRLGKNSLNLVK